MKLRTRRWLEFAALGMALVATPRAIAAEGGGGGEEFVVNSYSTSQQECPAIASNAAGDWVVVWESDYQDGSFDAVVLRLALHHFLNPAVALASARSVLRPGARLVVLDLLAPADLEARGLRDALERFRDPSHTTLVSLDEMRSHIRLAGFAVPSETVWSQRREFTEWARIINEPRRMADLRLVLHALSQGPGDPAGLSLSAEGGELWFTYDWGLFVATAA